MTRYLVPPDAQNTPGDDMVEVYYDHACGLAPVVLNRAPGIAQHVTLKHDRFHQKTHVACAMSMVDLHRRYGGSAHSTSVAESVNASLARMGASSWELALVLMDLAILKRNVETHMSTMPTP